MITKVYAIILILTGLFPILLSFDRNLQFYKRWNRVWPAIVIVAVAYVIPDIVFTKKGIWGFHSYYLIGESIFGLPVEEILFFLIIPFASIFIHYAFFHYFPELHVKARAGKIISFILILFFTLLFFTHLEQTYTAYVAVLMIIALAISFWDKSRIVDRFYTSFIIILVPFLIVNGILTGSFIRNEVVWYNPSAMLDIRFFTIPVEDFAYGFSLILFNLFLIEFFSKPINSKAK
jgi:lycopene cyclase domain-containing protein